MNMLRIVRYSLWSLVIAIVIGVSAVAFGLLPQNGDNDQSAGDVGGPFALTAMDGSAFSTDQIEGSPRAIFFGFTYCPDVCPTSLYEVSTWLDDLGKDGDQLKAYFITVDPERDTPDVLSNYLSAFGDRITGLTGTPDQIAEVARDYRVYFQRVDL
ncbi:MAG: SCO family protein, partial [Pseudomonadota bacterium]